MLLKILLFTLLVARVRSREECLHRDYGNTGTVCVCNAEHCDTIDPIGDIIIGEFVSYTSNLDGLRFEREVEKFTYRSVAQSVPIDYSVEYQTIQGFGGAFTDATGINILSLDDAAKDHLIRSYFSEDGIEYSLCRIPIGGTDFSTRSYSYLDTRVPDEELTAFALQHEDFTYKIPLILEALDLRNGNLTFFASAWTAPAWMKTNEAQDGDGELNRAYWQLWADYFMKFFELYKEEGIEFWGLTTGNEPSLAFFTWTGINSVGWLPWTLNKWVRRNLGPTLRNSEFADIKLMTHDDQRILLPLIFSFFADQEAADYIDGIAVHWYWDDFVPARWHTYIHEEYPDKFFLNTEACKGDRPWDPAVILGSWSRGETYAVNIIENLQHWSIGWIDWNMALNTTGGPTYIDNTVDSPIIVDAEAGEFFKQPMFYALGHYSKFVTPGSIRIDLPDEQNGVRLVAFLRPDNATVVVAINTQEEDVDIRIRDLTSGYIRKTISGNSFNTIVYWPGYTQKFPDEFLFGVATASYQVEGAFDKGGKGENIWDRITQTNPSYIDGEQNGNIACDTYSKTPEDVQLLVELGVKVYRFSISWSRILPTGHANEVNEEGIAYYTELIEELIANHIKPVVTMYHWDLPQPLQEIGGWPNPILADLFLEYAKVLFDHFGDSVKYWITFNEPYEFCKQGYSTNELAPGYSQDGVGGYLCGYTVLLAHARTYHYFKDTYPDSDSKIGISLNTDWFQPADPDSDDDIEAADTRLQFKLGWFANPIFSEDGDYPQVMKDNIEEMNTAIGYTRVRLPVLSDEDIDLIKGSADFFGLNHYTTFLCTAVTDAPTAPSHDADTKAECVSPNDLPGSASSWLKVAPEGFGELLRYIRDNYGEETEILITGNGFSDTGGLVDCDRVYYHNVYLEALLKAMEEDGVNVIGYHAWSFLDNFEWRRGYTEKFGLYHVDFDDDERTRQIKMSGLVYKNIIETKQIDWSYSPDAVCEWTDRPDSGSVDETGGRRGSSSSLIPGATILYIAYFICRFF